MAKLTQTARNTVSQYFSEIRHLPLLTTEEEKNLARDIQEGSQAAVNALVESNLGFVAKVASEYRSCGMPFEDLLNEGNLGLIEAARRFDPERETKFISYAVWWIRKTIRKALTDQSNLVRMPYSFRKKVQAVKRAEVALRRSLGHEPTREDLAEALDVDVEWIDRVRVGSVFEMSLDEPMGDEDESHFSSQLEDENATLIESKLVEREMGEEVSEAFTQLTDQERVVLSYRFGLIDGAALTLQATGEQIGLSRERVRQIEGKALKRLHKILTRPRPVRAPSKPPQQSVRMRSAGRAAPRPARAERTFCR